MSSLANSCSSSSTASTAPAPRTLQRSFSSPTPQATNIGLTIDERREILARRSPLPRPRSSRRFVPCCSRPRPAPRGRRGRRARVDCGKGFRQEISVSDHGARIKAVEALLREGLGRVGEAEVVEPRMPPSADEVKNLSDDELHFVFAQHSLASSPRSPELPSRSDIGLTRSAEASTDRRSAATPDYASRRSPGIADG